MQTSYVLKVRKYFFIFLKKHLEEKETLYYYESIMFM